ncbi:MAG: tryptophanase [Acidobacteriota bacterium]|nr:tryptophanase [Acidobacteriota bacterium]
MHHELLFEPFRIKTVEPIRLTTADERRRLLASAHYNLFLLHADDVVIDLLTDSGTGAMSTDQWGALMTGDESYAGSHSYYAFRDAVRDIFTMHEVIPVHQGRAAEHLLFSNICRAGQLVPNNTHFDTTRANLEAVGVEALDLPDPIGHDTALRHPFKGNMDLNALAELLAREHKRIPFVLLTITNNSAGGQPVSLENVRRIKEIIQPYDKPLYIDAARFAENAYFIKMREPGQAHKTAMEIARELFSMTDGVLMSAKKDGMANIGGFLALRDKDLAEQLRGTLVLTEGFPTYGGLAGRDLAALAVGFYEALDEHYLRYRLRTAEYVAEQLEDRGIPVLEPPGGHGVYVDAARLLPHIPPGHFPGLSLACALYLAGGVRSVEIGSLMFGAHDDQGHFVPAEHELLRLAFPRRVYTQSHFDYVVQVLQRIKDYAELLPGMEMVYEAPRLRHFISHFLPRGNFPEFTPKP